ncbi:MAG: hypothetical protein WC833_08790 [Bacteroidales bacterium]|jgi:hypothetical protein
MLNGFREQTQQLNDYELNTLLPIVIRGLETKIGRENAITNVSIVRGMRAHGRQINEPRVRKIINYIRTNNLVPLLIATSEGYYVAKTVDELDDYIDSLAGRERAIREVRISLERQKEKYMRKPANTLPLFQD